jgi:hypothetical protein
LEHARSRADIEAEAGTQYPIKQFSPLSGLLRRAMLFVLLPARAVSRWEHAAPVIEPCEERGHLRATLRATVGMGATQGSSQEIKRMSTSFVSIASVLAVSACALAQLAPASRGVTSGVSLVAAADDESHVLSSKATFAFTGAPFHEDKEILWPGFLNGLRGFEHFYEPVGQPLYFESPFNNTSVRALFLHHTFSDKSQLGGGEVNVAAVQARLALTERLGFIATKDGYSWLNAGILPEDSGWNAIAAGLKYAVVVDRENDFVLTPGIRFQTQGGESSVLQNSAAEFSAFVSAAKGFGPFHLIGDLAYRLPTDGDKGNDILQWDVHADYEILPESMPGFAPLVELHGLHYLSDGTALPLSVGGLDYSNIGSADVSGSTVVWIGAGARWKMTPNFSTGATYEWALTNRKADIMNDRITLDFTFTW